MISLQTSIVIKVVVGGSLYDIQHTPVKVKDSEFDTTLFVLKLTDSLGGKCLFRCFFDAWTGLQDETKTVRTEMSGRPFPIVTPRLTRIAAMLETCSQMSEAFYE